MSSAHGALSGEDGRLKVLVFYCGQLLRRAAAVGWRPTVVAFTCHILPVNQLTIVTVG